MATTKPLRPPARSALAILAAGFALALASCGIDTIAFLDTVTTVQQTGASSLVLRGPDSDDDLYDGLMIFYKIYANETNATTDYSYIVSKQNAENAVPGAVVESYLASTGGLNYQQVVLDGDIPIPTIKKANLTLDYYTAIDFPSGSSAEPVLTIYDDASGAVVQSFTLSRSSRGSDGTYLSFNTEPQAGDGDYQSSTSDADEKVYYVQFFAATYGLDLTDFSDLYGDAVYLHRIALNF
jgi:hypothetical protein